MLTPLLRERGKISDDGWKKPPQPNAFALSARADPVQSIVPVSPADQRETMASERKAAIETASAMFEQRSPLIRWHRLKKRILLVRREGHSIEKRNFLVKDSEIASRRHILCRGVGQPEKIIGNARANALARGRQPPVLNVALGKLSCRRAQQMLSCQPRLRQAECHPVLQLVAEAIRTACLIEARSSP